MARKKKHEEHENHERWLVSYADFITLLFAFFVVMYALSSVNEGKYRILSESLEAAFRGPQKSLTPIQFGEIVRSPVKALAGIRSASGAIDTSYLLESLGNQSFYDQAKHKLETMASEIEMAMAPLIKEDIISVRRNSLWIEVEIKTSLLFPSGSASLSRESIPVLRRIAAVLKSYPNRIQVEGFTDNVPINTQRYPSNWELSASRATTVVRKLAQFGIEPSRMVALGYAEYRPKADNSTAEGRSKNRRVVMTILAVFEAETPEGLSEKLAKILSPPFTTGHSNERDSEPLSYVNHP